MKKLMMSVMVIGLAAVVALGAANFVRDGSVIYYTNSGSAITAGDVVDLGDLYGVALVDIAASTGTGNVKIDGVWTFTLATNETISVGDKLYWDATHTNVTETATADKYLGMAVEAKTTTTSTTILQVLINPVRRDNVPAVDVQGIDADLTAIGALAKTDGNIIVGNGTTWVAESDATARTSLGLTIGTNVQAYSADLATVAAKTISMTTLTNVVYDSATGNVNVVTWAN